MEKNILIQTIVATESGRLDKLLQKSLDVSRNQIEQLIKKGLVCVNGKVVSKAGFKVQSEDLIEYSLPEVEKRESEEVNFDVEIIYEDDDIMVINKPSPLIVHPAPSVKEATLVDWLRLKGVSLSTISGDERQGIVHRLDKETSGAMVIAKNNESHKKLSLQLQNKSMGRYYVAIIDYPLKEDLCVEKPIARNPANRLKMGVVSGGKYAKTAFKKLAVCSRSNFELIAAKLYTGRTHQIRVHLNSLGRHIVGDSLYGFKSKNDTIKRIMLHAYILYLNHPKSGEMLYFAAPFPETIFSEISTCIDKERLHEILDPDSLLNVFNGCDGWMCR